MPDSPGVPMTPTETRAVQLELLRTFDDFCQARGLRYFLWAGTLLGAIRHGGVIPWDDDIDLAMPRADFERFCEAFAATHEDSLEFYTQDTRPEYAYPFARIADPRTLIVEGARISVPMGAFIDIFPMDGWPRNKVLARLHWLALKLLHSLVLVWGARPRADRELSKRLVIAVLKPVQWLPVRLLTRLITRVATFYAYDLADHVGVTVFRYVERVERRAYGEPAEIEFEGRAYRARPQVPDRILTRLYGDYMKLPPESERGERHIYGAYWIVDPAEAEPSLAPGLGPPRV